MKTTRSLMLLLSLSILLLLTPITRGQISDTFECLSASERKTITFANNPTRAVDGMPQIRILQGCYASQWAIQYAAFMFMREYLGMDVVMAPTQDPTLGWSEVGKNPNNDPLDRGYPENYFAWLSRDMIDLVLEFWPLQAESGEAYYLSGAVDFGGFVGAFGEISLWLPKYFVEEHPTSIIPSVLRNDPVIRAALMSGPVSGTTNYNDKYDDTQQTNSQNYTFDLPDAVRPTVWTSVNGWAMTRYAYNLTKNVPILNAAGTGYDHGLDMNVVPVKTEANMSAMIRDLYAQRLPFIANIYTVDDSFGSWDAVNGELQQFEKVAFPRNPDQSVYDQCYLDAVCQNPVEPLLKAANPRLLQRFPEAYEFFAGFSMSTTQVNRLIYHYIQMAAAGYSEEERWLRASCEWLKDPYSEPTWNTSTWMVNITRLDCLDGCGINGHGGSCDYYTGECVCDYPELFALFDCKQSCPGLEALSNGEFLFCSGHGTCDTFTKQCVCELGYGDSGCSTEYERYQYAIGLQGTIITFSAILACVGLACIGWLRMNAHYKTVKALSIDMTSIMTVGLLMIVCSNIALVVKLNAASCNAWQWLFGLGGILSIMSPLLKAYRVSRVFHGGKMLRAVKITDKMLMATLIKAAVVEVLICAGFTFAHQMFGGTEQFYNDAKLRIEDQCNQSTYAKYCALASYAYFFVMLCSLTYYSYGTRRALSVFKESTCAYFSSFLALFCTLIVFVFNMATNDPGFRTSVQAVAIIIVTGAVLALFYGTRVYRFFAEPENRNVTDMRQATTSSAFTASNSVMKPGPSEGRN